MGRGSGGGGRGGGGGGGSKGGGGGASQTPDQLVAESRAAIAEAEASGATTGLIDRVNGAANIIERGSIPANARDPWAVVDQSIIKADGNSDRLSRASLNNAAHIYNNLLSSNQKDAYALNILEPRNGKAFLSAIPTGKSSQSKKVYQDLRARSQRLASEGHVKLLEE